MPEVGRFVIVFTCGMIGIIMAFIFYTMYSQGILIDAYVDGVTITIENVMSFAIIMMTLLGVGIAALQ